MEFSFHNHGFSGEEKKQKPNFSFIELDVLRVEDIQL